MPTLIRILNTAIAFLAMCLVVFVVTFLIVVLVH